MHRLLAIDIDGTITGPDRRLGLEAARYLRELTYNGVCTVLATGNVLCFARSAQILIGTTGPVISENGGVIQMENDVEPEVLASPEVPRRAFESLQSETGAEEFPEERLTEVAVRDESVEESAVRELEERFDVEVLYTGFAYHVKDREVDKGDGLRSIAERAGFSPGEVVAIGDSENDVGMVEWAGTGVAVGNAHGVLKEVADFVVRDEFGEGLIEAIETLRGRDELP